MKQKQEYPISIIDDIKKEIENYFQDESYEIVALNTKGHEVSLRIWYHDFKPKQIVVQYFKEMFPQLEIELHRSFSHATLANLGLTMIEYLYPENFIRIFDSCCNPVEIRIFDFFDAYLSEKTIKKGVIMCNENEESMKMDES